MVDLKVNYASLDSSEQSLQRIATELEGADAQRAANADVWGSSDVAAAMGEFVDNWDRHRKQLVESLTSVGGMCASARECFTGTDQQLSAKMAGAGEE
jgi:hypothetical protein